MNGDIRSWRWLRSPRGVRAYAASSSTRSSNAENISLSRSTRASGVSRAGAERLAPLAPDANASVFATLRSRCSDCGPSRDERGLLDVRKGFTRCVLSAETQESVCLQGVDRLTDGSSSRCVSVWLGCWSASPADRSRRDRGTTGAGPRARWLGHLNDSSTACPGLWFRRNAVDFFVHPAVSRDPGRVRAMQQVAA
jgi:hypothetical protein